MATNVFDLFARLLLDTSGYEESLGNAKNLATSVGNGIKKGFGALATAAGAAFTAAGAATTKFVSDSVQAGMTFDKSMSQVAATMGYTVDQINDSTSEEAQNFQKLRDFALDMGKSTAFSASQAADALNYMALAGYDAETSMTMLPNVLNLAAAGGMELAQASDMVTDASSALGLDIENTTLMVDRMAAAASKSNTSVSQLGDAILTVGGTARDMKGGTTELATVLGLLADNGIKGAEGGTSLRNILLSLQGDKFEKTFGALGISMYDAEGKARDLKDVFNDMKKALSDKTPQERQEMLANTFNRFDLSAVNALLNTNEQRWDELTSAIENSENAAANMADTQLDNLAGDITLFKSALEGAEVVISDSLSPTLRGFVNFGTESIGKLTDAFSEGGLEGAIAVLPEILNKGIVKISEVLPQAIQVVQEVFSAIAENLPTIVQSVLPSLLSGILDVMQSLMKSIPSLVSTVFQTLGQVFGGDTVDSLFEAMQDMLDGVFDAIGQNFTQENVTKVLSWILDLIAHVSDLIGNNIGTVIDVAVQIIDAFVNSFYSPEIVTKILETATGIITALVEGLTGGDHLQKLLDAALNITLKLQEVFTQPEVVGALAEAASTIVFELAKGILQALPQIANSLALFCKNVVDYIVNYDWEKTGIALIEGFVNGFNAIDWSFLDDVEAKWVEFWNGFAEYWKPVLDGWSEFWQGYGEYIYDGINDAKQKWNEFWTKIGEGLKAGITDIKDGWVSFFEGIGAYVYDKSQQIFEPITTAWTLLKEFAEAKASEMLGNWVKFWTGIGEKIYTGVANVKNKFNDMKNSVATIMTNIVSSVSEKASNVRQTIINRVNDAVSVIKDLPNKAWTWGKDMIQNFVNGITSMVSKAGEAARNIAETIASYIHFSEPDVGPLSDFSTYAPDMIDTFVKGIEQNKQKISIAMNDALNVGFMDNIPAFTVASGGVSDSSTAQTNSSEAVIGILESILHELQKGHQVVLSTEMINRALGQTQVYTARGEIA